MFLREGRQAANPPLGSMGYAASLRTPSKNRPKPFEVDPTQPSKLAGLTLDLLGLLTAPHTLYSIRIIFNLIYLHEIERMTSSEGLLAGALIHFDWL
jgi:hypothetical protein